MNESTITFSGWVGSEVTLTEGSNGVAVASFRVGSTPRRFRGGRWEDGETIWYAVKAWRALATHVAASVRTGDPVVVSGRLVADVWKREDGTVSTRYVVVAASVGHDLTRGTSTFQRAARPEPVPVLQDDPVRRVVHSYDEGGPRLDGEGQVVGEPGSQAAGEPPGDEPAA
ncbi:single-stranded DNA-binding protein [Nocardioides campestrisoli]|uniref:single-stranded DNA-binding protein n=1 Tax=Nocardioides campestrisoli TaxID=2736757 RepID=UPI0015E66167|nr:single-stranded DNA-binding protein [Nocardioides campestrisoli]